MPHIGFTGTRNGLTPAQSESLQETLAKARGVLHHGDCVGADAEAHEFALLRHLRVDIHPPTDKRLRAFCHGLNVYEHPPKPYLDRNRDIVDSSTVLIGCPRDRDPMTRGGTWWTIRFARQVGKPVIIIFPDGVVEVERP